MTNKQRNQYNAYRSRLRTMDGNPAVWSAIAPMIDAVTTLRGTLDAIDAHARAQEELNPEGVTADKAEARRAVCDLAYALVLKLRPYARAIRDNEFLAAIDYSRTELERYPEMDVVRRCEIIHGRATQRLSDLASYGVTPSLMDELAAAIAAYRPLVGEGDGRIKDRASTTRLLAALLKQAREPVRLLDDLVPGLVTDQEFVERYRQAQQIIDR